MTPTPSRHSGVEHGMENTALQQRYEKMKAYLQADPDNLALLADVTDLALAVGDNDTASQLSRHALAQQPDDPYVRFRHANTLMAQRDYAAADQQFQQLREGGIDNLAMDYNQAYAQLWLGRYQEAGELLKRVVDVAEHPAGSRVMLARCLHHQGQTEAALEQVEQELQTRPQDGDALGLASLLYLDQNDFSRAGVLAEQALQYQPRSLDAWVTAGTVALQQEAPERAQQCFDRALTLNHDDGRTWAGQAMVLLLQGNIAAAIPAFERAVAIMPDHLGSLVALAWACMLNQQPERARTLFEQVIEKNHNFAEGHGGLAVIAAMQGQRELAADHAEKAVRLDAGNMSGHLAKALLSGRIQDASSFSQFAQRLLSRQPIPGGGNMADMLKRLLQRQQQP